MKTKISRIRYETGNKKKLGMKETERGCGGGPWGFTDLYRGV